VKVLSYDKAAETAGFVRRTLERLIAVGEGPPVIYISVRRRGILDSDLEEWLLKRRRLPPGEAIEIPAIPVGTTSFDPQCADCAEPRRSTATRSRAAGRSRRKISSGSARAGAKPAAE
jgi:hypothetical protein